MKKINLKELKNIIGNCQNKKFKIYDQKFNKEWINKLIKNDKTIKQKFINYDHKNNVNYILLMFENFGILYQNKKTKLTKLFNYYVDHKLSTMNQYVYFVVLKNERSIMDHH